jgi:hypothetical protein
MHSRAEPAAAALVAGLIAGIAGTALMTTYQSLVARIRQGSGGNGAGHGTPRRWKKAPPPAKIGRRLAEQTLHVEVPVERAPMLASTVHWTYGVAQGIGFGALKALAPRIPTVPLGAAFGSAIWGASYVVLPRLKVYEPITAYSPSTLALDLSYHLVYGLGVASTFAVASRFLAPDLGRDEPRS